MRRVLGAMCAALALGAGVDAQSPGTSRRDPAIERLVADAAIVPPEFAADALLRISTMPKVDTAWRRELLDAAYMTAYGAPEQYRRGTTRQIPPDSRQGAQLFAYATALTRVTLQIRAVQQMAFVDPERARDLFEWTDLNLAPGTCADPLVPVVDDYYSTLGLIARTTYSHNRADALTFLELYLWRAHLPSEMPPVARAIERFRSGPVEAAYLEGLFRLILQGGSADAPGFASAALDVISRSTDLQIADTGIGVPGSTVMDGLRSYLVAQLKSPRCVDNVTAALTASTFNSALRRARSDAEVQPLAGDAVRLPATAGSARIELYWQSGDAVRLHDAAARLHGPGVAPLPLRVRQSADWRNQAERLLTDVEQWSGRSEAAERDYFYQKSVLFAWMLDQMPASPVRTRALRAFVEFLRRSESDVDRRALWFAFVNRLLEMSRGPFRGEVLGAMEDSSHPVLWLYARLERLAPERLP
jgi:hypothetical protein